MNNITKFNLTVVRLICVAIFLANNEFVDKSLCVIQRSVVCGLCILPHPTRSYLILPHPTPYYTEFNCILPHQLHPTSSYPDLPHTNTGFNCILPHPTRTYLILPHIILHPTSSYPVLPYPTPSYPIQTLDSTASYLIIVHMSNICGNHK